MIAASFWGVLASAHAFSQAETAVESERVGVEASTQSVAHVVVPHGSTIPAGGLLLIPDSTNKRVMAFDPSTGNLINADYIPSDPSHFSTPLQAVLKPDGSGFLVSDQVGDVVQEYDLKGAYVRVFAPAGGVNTSILDNIRGIAFRGNGNLLVTVASGTNANAVAEFNSSGNYLGNFVANGAGGLASPFDVLARGAGFLVSGIDSDLVHSYDLSGAPGPDFAPVNNFPEQLAVTASSNVLVANFAGAQEGVVEFDSEGNVVGVYNPASLGAYRGVYELPNGNILTTTGSGVHEIDRAGSLVASKITGISARFITYVAPDLIFANGFE